MVGCTTCFPNATFDTWYILRPPKSKSTYCASVWVLEWLDVLLNTNAQSNIKSWKEKVPGKCILFGQASLIWVSFSLGEADLNYILNYDQLTNFQMTKTRTHLKSACGDGNMGIMLCDNSKLCGSTEFSLSNYNQFWSQRICAVHSKLDYFLIQCCCTV